MTLFNYALAANGAVGTASHTTGAEPAAQALDGSDATRWYSYKNLASDEWFKVDLGAPQYITELQVGTFSPANSTFTWQYSNDGVNYNTALTVDGELDGTLTRTTGGVTARYWQILIHRGTAGGIGLYYFNIVGPVEAPPPPTNPAAAYIAAWLDGLNANYKPAVDDWLDENL